MISKAWKPKQILMIIFFGKPGSGKTFLSKKLADFTGFFRISTDEIRSTFVKSATFSQEETTRIWHYIESVIEKNTIFKTGVIIDGCIGKASYRNRLLNCLPSSSSKKAVAIYMKCSDSVAKERIKSRTSSMNVYGCDSKTFSEIISEIEMSSEKIPSITVINEDNREFGTHARFFDLIEKLKIIDSNLHFSSLEIIKNKKAIVFDFSGTIVTKSPSTMTLTYQYLVEQNYIDSKTKLGELVFLTNAMISHERKPGKFYPEKKFWQNAMTLLGKPLKTGEMLFDNLNEYRQLGKIAENVDFSAIRKLKDSGFLLGILSNWSKHLKQYCDRIGISQYFDFIIASEAIDVEKPCSIAFIIALKKTGLKKTNVLYVGDNYFNDYLAANKVGIEAILFDPGGWYDSFPKRKITKLDQILEFKL